MFKKLLSMLLVLTLTAAIIPVAALGEEGETLYVSEVKMDDRDELESAGYSVFDEDLNSGTSKAAIYLGYKTTIDPTKAITDIKVLGEGKDYQMLNASDLSAEVFENDAMADAVVLMDVVREFRERFDGGENNARLVYAALQNYAYNADVRLGDYLVGWMDEADLSMVSLTADDDMKYGLYCALFAALLNSDESNWKKRLTDSEGEEFDESDSYYVSRARKLLVSIKSFRIAMEEAQGKEYGEGEQMDVSLEAAKENLESYEYKGATLYDYFMNPLATSTDFLPLANVLTDNELSMVQFIGFANFAYMQDAVASDEDVQSAYDEAAKVEIPTDFWQNSVKQQSGKIAVTSDAIREMATTDGGRGSVASDRTLYTSIGIGAAVVMTILFYAGKSLTQNSPKLVSFSKFVDNFAGAWKMSRSQALSSIQLISGATKTGQYFMSDAGMLLPATDYFIHGKNVGTFYRVAPSAVSFARTTKGATMTAKALSTTKVSMASRAFGIMGKTSVILILVALAVDFGLLMYDLATRGKIKHEEKPLRTLSLEDIEGGEVGYIMYDAVLKINGDAGDTNADAGDKWNVLFTTRDSAMGSPIKADTFYVSTSEKQVSGKAAAAYFGQVVAADLNKNAIDHGKSIYLFFERANADTLASIFARPESTVFMSYALLLLFSAVLILYRKKKNANAEI